MTSMLPPLVSADWLRAELGAPDLLVLDATLFLPAHGRDARAEFAADHIPGAIFMDLARFQPLPEPERLRTMLADLGAGPGVRAVVYDNSPLHSAARGWWLLRHAGLDAAVLDGGLAAWSSDNHGIRSRGQPTGAAPSTISKAELASIPAQIVDARSGPRFRGEEPEQRADVVPGHIPGSRNLPYAELFDAAGRMKSRDALRAAFEGAGVDPAGPMVATCGSGVTACNLILAAELLGNGQAGLYDGSWAEWGADPARPKAIGPA